MTSTDAEFLPLEDLAAIRRDNWCRQADHVAAHSRFYRRHFGNTALTGDIAELNDLPFTDKELLRADQAENGPFGSYLACPTDAISRIHRTSGTTGIAMNLALTPADAEMTAIVGARAQSAAGLGPGHRVVHCLNYQLWMGGYTDHAILERTGATVIPYGVGNTAGLIRTILELGVTAISCTPSYPAVLERTLQSEFPDLAPQDLGLKLGLFGGEPGLDDPAFRARLEETWSLEARNANYGVSDVLCNFAAQTDVNTDLHFMAGDVLHAQLIDPESGNLKPWTEGETGELVLTHLAKQAQPLVRFRTGDIITLTGIGKARCGRTAPRFRVIGRSDDMVVVRGLNLYPTMIASVLGEFSDLSGDYRIRLTSPPPHDALPVEAETAPGIAPNASLAETIADHIKSVLGATARVTLVPAGTFPVTEGKTRRVMREF